MDILSDYQDTLVRLQNLYNKLLFPPYSLRDHERIAIVADEIQDVEYAICAMKKRESDKCGYRPRRSTLMKRADLHIGVERED